MQMDTTDRMHDAARVPLVEPGTRPALAEIEQRIMAERGRVSVLYRALLNSGPIASGWEQLLTAVRNRTSIPGDLRELIILRVAVLNRASFEFDAHAPIALREGVDAGRIDALRRVPCGGFEAGLAADAPVQAGATGATGGSAASTDTAAADPDPDAASFRERERLVLRLTDAMTRDVEVPDPLMDALRARYGPGELVELVATVAAYNMVSRFLVALRITH
jgi:4-carboxymuconolactone decarboxylase